MLRNWDAIKATEPGREEGIFGDVPENLPALLHARKVQRRAASAGFDFPGVEPGLEGVPRRRGSALAAGRRRRPRRPPDERDALFSEVGDLLFAAVNVARKLRVDPELALRSASSGRFRGRVEAAARLAGEAEWRPHAGAPARLLRAAGCTRREAPGRHAAMSAIEKVHARQILDSRGNPTVEVELRLRSGAAGPRRRAHRAPPPASSRPPSCATAARPTAARA